MLFLFWLSRIIPNFSTVNYIYILLTSSVFSFLPRNFMKHPWCRKESRPDSPDSRPALPAPAPALPAPAAAPAHGLLDKAAVAAVEQVPNQNARAEYLGGEGYHWSSVDGFCWDFQHVELGSLHFLLKVGSFFGISNFRCWCGYVMCELWLHLLAMGRINGFT